LFLAAFVVFAQVPTPKPPPQRIASNAVPGADTSKPTIEALESQVKELQNQIAQRDAGIKQLQAAIEVWVKQFNSCMGDLVQAKSQIPTSPQR
jgi:peptidoglycan hydrolase CwlO-like protein